MLTHLMLMRHAKSSWTDASMTDHERPLNSRGRNSADLIGQTLTARGYAPDMIWSSDSARTKETAMRMIREIPGAQVVHYFPEFYHASVNDVLSVCLREAAVDSTDFERLMLLGHNPGWSSLFDYFCVGRSPLSTGFPTAACAIFERKQGVDDIWYSPNVWRLVDLLLPRDLQTHDVN